MKSEFWLTRPVQKSLSERPPVKHLDELPELQSLGLCGKGTALDSVRVRPSTRTKAIKKAKKQLAEMEEWIEFLNKAVRVSKQEERSRENKGNLREERGTIF